MRPALISLALILAPFVPLHAGGDPTPASTPLDLPDTTPAPSNLKTTYEFNADTSYVGDASTNFGSGSYGDVSEERARAHLVVSPQYNDGPIYRFGLAYQRYSFGLSKAAPLPDLLQTHNLILGLDFQLFNSWLIRVEADPGLYGDSRSLGFRDFNVPFLIGASYITGADLQWVLGLDVDIDRQLPIIPAIGARWSFADNWVIDAILPTPRLEYDWSKALTLYIGGDADDGTFKVDRGLGTTVGRPDLSGAIVEYDEIRVGAGLSWKALKGLTFELEGGYLPYREFDYHRADTHFTNANGAPYGQISLNAQF
jgi:hypothetical protein